MASTKAQLRAQQNYSLKRKKDNVSARYYAPLKQHEALKKLSKKTGKTLEELTNEFVTAGLKSAGMKV